MVVVTVLFTQVQWIVLPKASYPGTTHFVLHSQFLKTDVGYCVWTPPGYAETTKKYPLIMVLHGMGGDESHDAGLYGFPPQLETAIKEGRIPPAIVVFPNGGSSGYQGKAEQMILREVLPEVDRNYRTTAQRALCGFSMGAGGASRWLFAHSDLFQVALVWGGGPPGGVPSKDLSKTHSLWVICGDQDPARSVKRLTENLSKSLFECRFTLLQGVGHELGKYHEQTLQDGFILIAKTWNRLSKKK